MTNPAVNPGPKTLTNFNYRDKSMYWDSFKISTNANTDNMGKLFVTPACLRQSGRLAP
jgi:hypothetical protein